MENEALWINNLDHSGCCIGDGEKLIEKQELLGIVVQIGQEGSCSLFVLLLGIIEINISGSSGHAYLHYRKGRTWEF